VVVDNHEVITMKGCATSLSPCFIPEEIVDTGVSCMNFQIVHVNEARRQSSQCCFQGEDVLVWKFQPPFQQASTTPDTAVLSGSETTPSRPTVDTRMVTHESVVCECSQPKNMIQNVAGCQMVLYRWCVTPESWSPPFS
jgi:hypothetical protein